MRSTFRGVWAGALQAYDLPDLMGCIAPRRLLIDGIRDQTLEPALDKMVEEELAFPRKAYSFTGKPDNLKIFQAGYDIISLTEWSFGNQD